MENTTLIFIDSNYWIYLFDETTVEHIDVKKHFEKFYDQYQFVINIPVMIEVMHYLVKRLGANLAKPKWDLFSSMNFIYDDLTFQDLDLVFNELSDFTHAGIGAREATILTSMKKLSVQKICTHDKSFKQVPNIEVIDPIS
ncbi:MAG: type II toxin-antitoxin system VapC family toxin [Candidatus Hodarchaeales archaeon]|jgi:predicted nucleic acid-binding protein